MNRERRWCGRAKESGSAVVEFAICSTLLVPLSISALFFTELSLVKLKVQEATRYVAWEVTDFRLSDYGGEGQSSHDVAFANALVEVAHEAEDRYGDDLDGATQNPNIRSISSLRKRFLALDLSPASLAVNGQNHDAGALDFSGLASPVVGHLSPSTLLFDRFGFNSKGLLFVTLSVRVRVPFFNPRFKDSGLGRGTDLVGPSGLLVGGAPIEMLIDAWTLPDGSDVRLFPTTVGGAPSDYGKEVGRMAFEGLETSLGGVDAAISAVRKILPIEDPMSASRLTSITYDRNNGYSSGRVSLSVNSGVDRRHNRAQSSFHTAPIRENWKYDESESCLTLDQLDEGYMGCVPGSESAPGAGEYPCLFAGKGICQ